MIEPVVLQGKYVRLEPLTPDHYDGLCEAISDGRLWELFVTLVPDLDQVRQFIQQAELDFRKGV